LRAFRLALGAPTLPAEVEALLRAVKPTRWRGSKVSGIDLASDFVWIDDDPLAVEVDTLRAHGLLHRLLTTTMVCGVPPRRLKRGLALPRYRTRRNPEAEAEQSLHGRDCDQLARPERSGDITRTSAFG
jgi:hypothetical protein